MLRLNWFPVEAEPSPRFHAQFQLKHSLMMLQVSKRMPRMDVPPLQTPVMAEMTRTTASPFQLLACAARFNNHNFSCKAYSMLYTGLDQALVEEQLHSCEQGTVKGKPSQLEPWSQELTTTFLVLRRSLQELLLPSYTPLSLFSRNCREKRFQPHFSVSANTHPSPLPLLHPLGPTTDPPTQKCWVSAWSATKRGHGQGGEKTSQKQVTMSRKVECNIMKDGGKNLFVSQSTKTCFL